jgi:pSer/pThr/pTyr-binding forkhead associated (FHA) protein
MPYQLVVVQGRSSSQAVRLSSSVTTVGRQEDCQLRIKSSQVSRKHCQLFEKKGLLLVKDLGSSNGTFVNGKKVDDQRVLEAGDELTIGGVKFKIEKVEEAAATAASTTKPGDTAIAEPVAAAVVDDADIFEVSLDETETDSSPSPAPATLSPAVTPPPPTRTPEPEPEPEDQPIELGEDAVADFLMDLNIDDDDR